MSSNFSYCEAMCSGSEIEYDTLGFHLALSRTNFTSKKATTVE